MKLANRIAGIVLSMLLGCALLAAGFSIGRSYGQQDVIEFNLRRCPECHQIIGTINTCHAFDRTEDY